MDLGPRSQVHFHTFTDERSFLISSFFILAYFDGLDASIPVVLTNANISGDPALAGSRQTVPWAVKTVGGRKVGYIALIPYNSKQLTNYAKDTIVDNDSNAMTYRALSALKRAHPDCSIIIAVGGQQDDDQNSDAAFFRSQNTFLKEFAEHVDVVILRVDDGNDVSTTLLTNIFGDKVVSLQVPKGNGAGLGHAELVFDELGNLQAYSSEVSKIESLDIDEMIW